MFDIAPFLGGFYKRGGTITLNPSQPVMLCPADPTRAYLMVYESAGFSCGLNTADVRAQSPPMWPVTVLQPIEFWWPRHGIMTTMEWWVFPMGASGNATFIWTGLYWQTPQEV